MLMNMSLPECDIYQVQELQIILSATQTLDVFIIFKKGFVWYPVWNSPCQT